jgi:hypothetical protein
MIWMLINIESWLLYIRSEYGKKNACSLLPRWELPVLLLNPGEVFYDDGLGPKCKFFWSLTKLSPTLFSNDKMFYYCFCCLKIPFVDFFYRLWDCWMWISSNFSLSEFFMWGLSEQQTILGWLFTAKTGRMGGSRDGLGVVIQMPMMP